MRKKFPVSFLFLKMKTVAHVSGNRIQRLDIFFEVVIPIFFFFLFPGVNGLRSPNTSVVTFINSLNCTESPSFFLVDCKMYLKEVTPR